MATLEEKIDKIAEDSAYMRGRWDSTIPSLQRLIEDHEKRIQANEKTTENITTKVGLAGALSGTIFSAIIMWIFKRF